MFFQSLKSLLLPGKFSGTGANLTSTNVGLTCNSTWIKMRVFVEVRETSTVDDVAFGFPQLTSGRMPIFQGSLPTVLRLDGSQEPSFSNGI